MRLCCVVSSLGGGGAERVMASLANSWAAAGEEVAVITLAPDAGDGYRLDPRVRRVGLDLMTNSRWFAEAAVQNLRRIRVLRGAIRAFGPDVVISFNAPINVLVILACARLNIRVAVSERAHPPADYIGRPWSFLRRLTYPFADAVIVQTEGSRPWAHTVARARRVHVIPNAVGVPFTDTAPAPTRSRTILGMGRLVRQKGFDLLVQAFSSVAHEYPDWSLTIVGRGREEESLRTLAAKLGSAHAITLKGTVYDPEQYFRSVGLFVLPSRFEGFPNVLLEAMACGCAVIASDCPVGPAEIVRHGVDGVLVPPGDIDCLAREMRRLMKDEGERVRLGARAREVADRFSTDRVMRLWGDVIAAMRQ